MKIKSLISRAAKILILSHNFDPFIGGIEVTTKVLANSFVKAGHEVHLLTWTADKSQNNFQFEVIRNPRIRRIFEEHAWADCVLENNPCLRLAWPGLFFRRPVFVVLHTWISRPDGRIGIKDRVKLIFWLNRARKVITVSEALRDRSYKKALMLGSFYREDQFRIIKDIDRKKSFVFLGRLVSDKGAHLAIQAIFEIVNFRGKVSFEWKPTLTIIGDGPERVSLEELTMALGLKNQITFLGALGGEKLVRCLNEHRFILVPSTWEEPFGLVALEGMACGCVPIVSDGGGLPEAIGNAGYKFKRGNLKSLANCMKEVITHTKQEEKFRHAASEHLRKYHSGKIAQLYLEEIELTLRNKKQ